MKRRVSITFNKLPECGDMFIKCIKALGTWYKTFDNQFIVYTDKDAAEIQDRFLPYFKESKNGAQFIAVELNSDSGGWHFTKFWNWFNHPENEGNKDEPSKKNPETDKEDLLVKTDQF